MRCVMKVSFAVVDPCSGAACCASISGTQSNLACLWGSKEPSFAKPAISGYPQIAIFAHSPTPAQPSIWPLDLLLIPDCHPEPARAVCQQCEGSAFPVRAPTRHHAAAPARSGYFSQPSATALDVLGV